MGTRGLFGFYYNGKYYIFYNHWDSYFRGGLGAALVKEIIAMVRDEKMDEWKSMLSNLIVISQDTPPPTSKEIEKLNKYANVDVDDKSIYNWHVLLRKCQGSFKNTLESGYGIVEYDESYLGSGKGHIEYSYILNFDDNTFTAYDCEQKMATFNIFSLCEMFSSSSSS